MTTSPAPPSAKSQSDTLIATSSSPWETSNGLPLVGYKTAPSLIGGRYRLHTYTHLAHIFRGRQILPKQEYIIYLRRKEYYSTTAKYNHSPHLLPPLPTYLLPRSHRPRRHALGIVGRRFRPSKRLLERHFPPQHSQTLDIRLLHRRHRLPRRPPLPYGTS